MKLSYSSSSRAKSMAAVTIRTLLRPGWFKQRELTHYWMISPNCLIITLTKNKYKGLIFFLATFHICLVSYFCGVNLAIYITCHSDSVHDMFSISYKYIEFSIIYGYKEMRLTSIIVHSQWGARVKIYRCRFSPKQAFQFGFPWEKNPQKTKNKNHTVHHTWPYI